MDFNLTNYQRSSSERTLLDVKLFHVMGARYRAKGAKRRVSQRFGTAISTQQGDSPFSEGEQGGFSDSGMPTDGCFLIGMHAVQSPV